MPLNNREEYIIIGMISDGKSKEEIIEFLKNKKPNEVEEFYNKITAKNQNPSDQNINDGVIQRFLELGIQPNDIIDIIQSIKNKNDKSVEQIKDEVIEMTSSEKLLKKTSDRGNKGVVVMTQPASERSDELNRHMRPKPANYLFKRT